jgi:hypothetical protein
VKRVAEDTVPVFEILLKSSQQVRCLRGANRCLLQSEKADISVLEGAASSLFWFAALLTYLTSEASSKVFCRVPVVQIIDPFEA